jgi:transposase-like protein
MLHRTDSNDDRPDRLEGGARNVNVPAACPSCRSSAITTTAKNPDASSYWRCNTCGEIWNVSRRDGATGGAQLWR